MARIGESLHARLARAIVLREEHPVVRIGFTLPPLSNRMAGL